jgi:hypothetical protein
MMQTVLVWQQECLRDVGQKNDRASHVDSCLCQHVSCCNAVLLADKDCPRQLPLHCIVLHLRALIKADIIRCADMTC